MREDEDEDLLDIKNADKEENLLDASKADNEDNLLDAGNIGKTEKGFLAKHFKKAVFFGAIAGGYAVGGVLVNGHDLANAVKPVLAFGGIGMALTYGYEFLKPHFKH